MDETRTMTIANVGNGIELLDAKTPGWWHSIDLIRLNLMYFDSCVLGQVYGHYWDGLDALELDSVMADDYGFALFDGRYEDFSYLTRVWRDAIRHRQVTESAA